MFFQVSLLFLFISSKSKNKLELFVWLSDQFLIKALFALFLWLGSEKKYSFRLGFMNSKMYSSVKFIFFFRSELLHFWTFLFPYRRLYYRTWVTFFASKFSPNFDEGHEECMTGGMQFQSMRNSRQDRGRSWGMYDSRGPGHDEFMTGGIHDEECTTG